MPYCHEIAANGTHMAPRIKDQEKAEDAREALREVKKAADQVSGDIQNDLLALRDDFARLAEQVSDILANKGGAAWQRARASVASDFQDKGFDRAHLRKIRRAAGSTGIVVIETTDELPLAPAPRARTDILNELAGHGYSEEELSDLVVPKRTLARRRSENELLTVEETDKALRLKRIATLTEKVFGDPAKAQRWMRKPKRSLSSATPLAYLASENGARIVEEMLRRIEHGIFA
jgi:putative toxin-antitoxin system antitoxin component (TIGR02293 family)